MIAIALLLAAAAPCTPTLGADLTDISRHYRETRSIPGYVAGALVRVVWAGGPAGRAGINAGDVIQGVGGDLVQNACDVKQAVAKHGCGEVRITLRRGVDTLSRDLKLADAKRFPRKKLDDAAACQGGDAAACTALARAHEDDVVLLRQACDLGDGEGCFMLGLKLGNDREGAAAYEQACDAGNPLACTNLGWMYQNGRGVPADLQAARRLYERGCNGTRCSGRNNLGCVNLGRVYRDGLGVPKDDRRANTLMREVCERGARPGDEEDATVVARSCSLAGTGALLKATEAGEVRSALGMLEEGCSAGDTFGCFNLGAFYETGNHVERDVQRAAGYYKIACDHGDTEACQRRQLLKF